MTLRRHVLLAALLATCLSACARPVRMAPAPEVRGACRGAGAAAAVDIAWVQPDTPRERRALDERCAAVGPPLIVQGTAPRRAPVTRVLVATWNLHDGRGDVVRLVRDLQRGLDHSSPPDAIVLLLQEVVRTLHTPPGSAPAAAGRVYGAGHVPSAVASLGWHFAYLGARPYRVAPQGTLAADRGTAILSSLPIERLQAIELPVERQRRIALAATVRGTTAQGREWTLRVVSAHLENRSGARRVWVRAGASRTRQAEALLEALDLQPTDGRPMAHMPAIVLGGDFNTWLGTREHAYERLAKAFGAWPREDARPTLAFGMRLDHLFARVPAGVARSHRRLDHKYGSDHYPVVAEIVFGTI